MDEIGIGCAAASMIIIAWVAAVEVRTALRTQVAGLRGWPAATRSDRPLLFWFYTRFQFAAGAICLGLGVLGAVSLLA